MEFASQVGCRAKPGDGGFSTPSWSERPGDAGSHQWRMPRTEADVSVFAPHLPRCLSDLPFSDPGGVSGVMLKDGEF